MRRVRGAGMDTMIAQRGLLVVDVLRAEPAANEWR
jgi:hypothetical protein